MRDYSAGMFQGQEIDYPTLEVSEVEVQNNIRKDRV